MAGFVTQGELEDRVGPVDSDRASAALAHACALIRGATGQAFDQVENETISLDGSGTDAVLLPQLPVLSITSVEDDGVELELDQYDFSNAGLLRRLDSDVWTRGRAKVKVTYSYGHAEAPGEIKALALTIATRLYDQGGVVSETVGATSATYATDQLTLTKGEQAIIKRYRVYRQDFRVDEVGT